MGLEQIGIVRHRLPDSPPFRVVFLQFPGFGRRLAQPSLPRPHTGAEFCASVVSCLVLLLVSVQPVEPCLDAHESPPFSITRCSSAESRSSRSISSTERNENSKIARAALPRTVA